MGKGCSATRPSVVSHCSCDIDQDPLQHPLKSVLWPLPPSPAPLLYLPDLATLAGLVGFSPKQSLVKESNSGGFLSRCCREEPRGGGRSRVVNRGQPRVRLQVQFQTVPDATGSCEGTVPRRVSGLGSSMPVSDGAPAGHSCRHCWLPAGEAPPASAGGR